MGRPATISREQILDAAIEILEEGGLGKVSMRRVGRALGVEAMSLYRHVDGKAGLLDGLHERLLGRMGPVMATGDWRHDLEAHARAFRQLLRRYPSAVPLFARRAAITPGSVAYLELGLTILAEAGLPPRQALFAFQALYELVVGHAQFQRGHDETPALDGFPRAAAALGDGYDPDTGFDFALTCLLDGIAGRAQR